MNTASSDSRPFALLAVALVTAVAGGALGAVTNAVNGAISPEYFVSILGWRDVQDVGRAAIAQGVYEGLIYGAIFGIVYALVMGIVSRATVAFQFAASKLGLAAVVAIACWSFGGVAGVGLAMLSPDFFCHAFRGVPTEHADMLRYAWVGGSIWGVMFGTVLALVVTPPRAAAAWRRKSANP